MSGDREGGSRRSSSAFSDAMNPAPEISAYNLGRAYLEEKNYAEAVNWLRTSLNRNKAYSEAYLLLAETLLALGSRRRGGRRARGGRQGGADGRRAAARARQGLLQGRALLGRAGEARGGAEARPGRRRPGAPRRSSSRRCRSRPGPLPYRRILEALLARVAGARTALLLDVQGEVVVGAGDLGERQRLIGAYQGILLGMASRTAGRFDVGRRPLARVAPRRRVGGARRRSRTATTSWSRSTRRALPAVAARHCQDARARLDEEI